MSPCQFIPTQDRLLGFAFRSKRSGALQRGRCCSVPPGVNVACLPAGRRRDLQPGLCGADFQPARFSSSAASFRPGLTLISASCPSAPKDSSNLPTEKLAPRFRAEAFRPPGCRRFRFPEPAGVHHFRQSRRLSSHLSFCAHAISVALSASGFAPPRTCGCCRQGLNVAPRPSARQLFAPASR